MSTTPGTDLRFFSTTQVSSDLRFITSYSGLVLSQGVEVDLPDGAPVGSHLRDDIGWQRDLREPLQHAFAVFEVCRILAEDHLYGGEPEDGPGADMNHARNAVHHGFERNGDLLLDLLGGDARPLRDDIDVVVGDVRIGLDRQMWNEMMPQAKSRMPIARTRSGFGARNRLACESLRLHRGFQLQNILDDLLAGRDAGENFLLISRQHAARAHFHAPELFLAGRHEDPFAVVQMQDGAGRHKGVRPPSCG